MTKNPYKGNSFIYINTSFALRLHYVNMPYCNRRVCPICGKHDLLKLSEHLRQVHNFSKEERQPYLKKTIFSQSFSPSLNPLRCMETEPYPTFQFEHPSMMTVVGPTQSGKTHFVEQLLSSNCIKYPSRKTKRIQWFYSQWQPLCDRLQSTLENGLTFTQGLPNVNDNLEDINDKIHNLWVLDDLMDEAVQSPIISQLFTRGRHRNLSVILLLQNMFPKGKFYTNISRNAQYMVLFHSPSDREQMDIVPERIFAKERSKFMAAYMKETKKPYGYISLDNHPQTANEKQVVANVFDDCYTYPFITKSTHSELTQRIPDMESLSIEQSDVKNHSPKTSQVSVKRKVELQKPPAKKAGKQQAKAKPRTTKKQTKPKVYKPRFIVTPPRETLSSEEEEFNSEAEPFSSEDESFTPTMSFEDELNSLAGKSNKNGFGPKIMCE